MSQIKLARRSKRLCLDALAFLAFTAVFTSASVETATAQVPAALRNKTIILQAEAEVCARPKTSSSKACSVDHRTEKSGYIIYVSDAGQAFFYAGPSIGVTMRYGDQDASAPGQYDSGSKYTGTASVSSWYPQLIFTYRQASDTTVQTWTYAILFSGGTCQLLSYGRDVTFIKKVANDVLFGGHRPVSCKIYSGHREFDALGNWD